MERVVTGRDIRVAVQATLETWLPSVLAELVRRAGMAGDPADPLNNQTGVTKPRTWTRLPDLAAMTADQSPMVAVATPGLVGEPKRDGQGAWHATWAFNVFDVVRGESYQDTADTVGVYTAAIRACLLQHRPAIDGAKRPQWLDESYHELSATAARTIGAGVVRFSMAVADAVTDLGAPAAPPPPLAYTPPGDGPQVVREVLSVDSL